MPRCKVKDCDIKNALFGYPDKLPECCAKHKENGMINLKTNNIHYQLLKERIDAIGKNMADLEINKDDTITLKNENQYELLKERIEAIGKSMSDLEINISKIETNITNLENNIKLNKINKNKYIIVSTTITCILLFLKK